MSMLRRLLPWLACCVLLAGTPARAAQTLPPMSDLHADGLRSRAEARPLLLLFSLPDCRYCEEVRRNYLLPLARDAAAAGRPLVREGGLDSEQPVTGIDGAPTTPKQLAERYHVRVAPTVLFLDDDGKQLAEPLLGGDTSGMYGAYLDNALEQAARGLQQRPTSH